MEEDVLASRLGLNEAIPFRVVESLHTSLLRHLPLLLSDKARVPVRRTRTSTPSRHEETSSLRVNLVSPHGPDFSYQPRNLRDFVTGAGKNQALARVRSGRIWPALPQGGHPGPPLQEILVLEGMVP